MIDFARKNAERVSFRNGPELWNLLLNRVRADLDATAVIAGGAVRDYILGIEPKDIDVFVNVGADHLEAYCDQPWEGFDMGLYSPGDAGNYALDTDWNPETMKVLDGAWYPNWPHVDVRVSVQIISHPVFDFGCTVSDFADAIMNRMDIGLCQAVYVGNFKDDTPLTYTNVLRKSSNFDYDLANFKLTIIRQQSAAGIRASVNRVERIMQRLNDLTISGFSWRDEEGFSI